MPCVHEVIFAKKRLLLCSCNIWAFDSELQILLIIERGQHFLSRQESGTVSGQWNDFPQLYKNKLVHYFLLHFSGQIIDSSITKFVTGIYLLLASKYK